MKMKLVCFCNNSILLQGEDGNLPVLYEDKHTFWSNFPTKQNTN